MYCLNRAQVLGNVTRDPEVRQIASGQMVCTLGIATNRSWKDQSGNKQEAVEFHSVVLWTRLAEIAGQYLKKGNKVYVEGRLQTRSWDNEAGTKQYRTEIVAENIIMLSPKSGMGSREEAEFSGGIRPPNAPSPAPVSEPMMAGAEKISVEDLPF